MPELPSINRVSRTETLKDLYDRVHTDPRLSASNYGNIRSHLIAPKNNITDTGWGLSKLAGTAVVNYINGTAVGIAGRDVHIGGFYAIRRGNQTAFTRAGEQYAKEVLKHDNTQYHG
jgi:hypothetical protein